MKKQKKSWQELALELAEWRGKLEDPKCALSLKDRKCICGLLDGLLALDDDGLALALGYDPDLERLTWFCDVATVDYRTKH